MKIKIYHTNDIHSNYNFLEKAYDYIKRNKKENDLYFDSGDYLDLSSILVEADGGKLAMDLLMDMDLDLMTFGNNEMDLGKERIVSLLEKGYPIMSSNVKSLDGSDINNLIKSQVFERFGKKILVIGSAPYYAGDLSHDSYNMYFVLGGMKTVEPIETLRQEIEKHPDYDFLIYLSHSGHIVDPYILKNIPEIDLTLGAHTHIIVSEKDYSMSGKGDAIGVLTLEVESDKIEVVESKQVYVDDLENEDFKIKLEKSYDKARSLLSKPVKILEDLAYDPFEENPLMNFLCDAMYKKYDVDFAIIHNGIGQGPLLNPLTELDIVENFPSKLNPCVYMVKGENIRKAIKDSFDYDYIRQDGKAPGFRGIILGSLSYSHNVSIDKNTRSIKINGEDLDDEIYYTIASSDYLQRGAGYPSMKNKEIFYDKYFIKEFVKLYLEDEEVFRNSKIKRIN